MKTKSGIIPAKGVQRDNFLEDCRMELAQLLPEFHGEFVGAWKMLNSRGKVDTYLNLARIVLPTVKAINMDMTAQLSESLESRLSRLNKHDVDTWETTATSEIEEEIIKSVSYDDNNNDEQG